MTWFLRHRNRLILLVVCAAIGVSTAVGAEDYMRTFGGALMALIVVSLFDLWEYEPRKQ